MRPPHSRYEPQVGAERLAVVCEAHLLVGQRQTRDRGVIGDSVCDRDLSAVKAAATTLLDVS
jgi:CO/xanthine dehydrogenase FAD-binding subunit